MKITRLAILKVRNIISQTPTISKFLKKWVSCKQNHDGISFKYAITTPPPHHKIKRVIAVTKNYERRLEHMKNLDIREALKNANMRHWVLADELGIDESTLTRWLRHELPKDKKDRIMKIIESYK